MVIGKGAAGPSKARASLVSLNSSKHKVTEIDDDDDDDDDDDAYFMRNVPGQSTNFDDLDEDAVREDLYGGMESSSDSDEVISQNVQQQQIRKHKRKMETAMALEKGAVPFFSDESDFDLNLQSLKPSPRKARARHISPPPKLSKEKIKESSKQISEWMQAHDLVSASIEVNSSQVRDDSGFISDGDDGQAQKLADILSRYRKSTDDDSEGPIRLSIVAALPEGLKSKSERIQAIYTTPMEFEMQRTDSFEDILHRVLDEKGLKSQDTYFLHGFQRVFPRSTPRQRGLKEGVSIDALDHDAYLARMAEKQTQDAQLFSRVAQLTQPAPKEEIKDEGPKIQLVFRHQKFGDEKFRVGVNDTLKLILQKYLKKHSLDPELAGQTATLNFDGESLDLSQTVATAADGDLEEDTIVEVDTR